MSAAEQARRLYEAMDNKVVPAWDQLGARTQGVWIRYAEKLLPPSSAPSPGPSQS